MEFTSGRSSNLIKLEGQQTHSFQQDEKIQIKKIYNSDDLNKNETNELKTLHHKYIIKNELVSEETDLQFDINKPGRSSIALTPENTIQESEIKICNFIKLEGQQTNPFWEDRNIHMKEELSSAILNNEGEYELKALHHECIIKEELSIEEIDNEEIRLGNFKVHVNNRNSKQNMYKCDYCEYESAYFALLKMHVNVKHTKQNMHKCDYCDYESANFTCLKVHVNAKHTNENMHKCDYCDYEFAYFANLKKHVNAKHTKQNMHKCDYCDFETAYASYIKVHVSAKHTKENMHKCDYCDYETAYPSKIKVHIRAKHTKQNMLKCNYCEHKSAQRCNLKKHVRVKHTKQIIYQKK